IYDNGNLSMNGDLVVGGNAQINGDLVVIGQINPTAPSGVGLLVQGLTSQSGDLQQWKNVSGTVLAKITSAGAISAANLSIASGKVATISNTLTFTGTDSSSVAFGAGGFVVYTGPTTGSGLTMTTARLLGRTTASTGAIEEITVGSGLSLSGGT